MIWKYVQHRETFFCRQTANNGDIPVFGSIAPKLHRDNRKYSCIFNSSNLFLFIIWIEPIFHYIINISFFIIKFGLSLDFSVWSLFFSNIYCTMYYGGENVTVFKRYYCRDLYRHWPSRWTYPLNTFQGFITGLFRIIFQKYHWKLL